MRSLLPFLLKMRVVVLLVLLFSLSGCDTLNKWLAPDRIDYQDVPSPKELKVPSDLSQIPDNQHFYSPALDFAGSSSAQASQVNDLAKDVFFEQNSDRLWLIIQHRTSAQLWPVLVNFWRKNGFSLVQNFPESGLLVTNWAENRALIPNDWIRRVFGKVLNFVYSSGTKDRYTMLVSPDREGVSISITHSGVQEVAVGRDSESTKWEMRPRDPQLEKVFLVKLLQDLGITAQQAQTMLNTAKKAHVTIQKITLPDGAVGLQTNVPIDTAWKRIGVILDRSNFVIQHQDTKNKIYDIAFVDAQKDADRAGLLTHFFGQKKTSTAAKAYYQIQLIEKSPSETQIILLNPAKSSEAAQQAEKIIDLLIHQFQ